MVQQSRRLFLRNLGLVLAAPAIVSASSLMPVRSIDRFAGMSNAQLIALLEQRIENAQRLMEEHIAKTVFGLYPPDQVRVVKADESPEWSVFGPRRKMFRVRSDGAKIWPFTKVYSEISLHG